MRDVAGQLRTQEVLLPLTQPSSLGDQGPISQPALRHGAQAAGAKGRGGSGISCHMVVKRGENVRI